MTALAEFSVLAATARDKIPRGKVDWSDSPFAWMRHHGPRTKSKLGRDIVQAWFESRQTPYAEINGIAHFRVAEKDTIVHFALLSKEGVFEFAQLRAPGNGVDWMLLVGVEPHRARIWAVRPSAVTHLATYVTDAPGLHHCSFDPDDLPEWLTLVASWE